MLIAASPARPLVLLHLPEQLAGPDLRAHADLGGVLSSTLRGQPRRMHHAGAVACRRSGRWGLSLIGGSGNSAYNHPGGQATYSGVKAMRGGERTPEAGGQVQRAREQSGGVW